MNKIKDSAVEKIVNDSIAKAKKDYPDLVVPGSKVRYSFGDFGTEDLVSKFIDDGITAQLDFIASTFNTKKGTLSYLSSDENGIGITNVVVEVESA